MIIYLSIPGPFGGTNMQKNQLAGGLVQMMVQAEFWLFRGAGTEPPFEVGSETFSSCIATTAVNGTAFCLGLLNATIGC